MKAYYSDLYIYCLCSVNANRLLQRRNTSVQYST